MSDKTHTVLVTILPSPERREGKIVVQSRPVEGKEVIQMDTKKQVELFNEIVDYMKERLGKPSMVHWQLIDMLAIWILEDAIEGYSNIYEQNYASQDYSDAFDRMHNLKLLKSLLKKDVEAEEEMQALYEAACERVTDDPLLGPYSGTLLDQDEVYQISWEDHCRWVAEAETEEILEWLGVTETDQE